MSRDSAEAAGALDALDVLADLARDVTAGGAGGPLRHPASGCTVAPEPRLHFQMPCQVGSEIPDLPYSHSDRTLVHTERLAEGAGMGGCRWWEGARMLFCYDAGTKPRDLLRRDGQDREPSSPWPRQQLGRENDVGELSKVGGGVA